MGCSIASDVWLSDRISSWISKVLFVTRMSSEEDSRWFPTTLSWRRSRKSSKGTQRRPGCARAQRFPTSQRGTSVLCFSHDCASSGNIVQVRRANLSLRPRNTSLQICAREKGHLHETGAGRDGGSPHC